MFKLSLSKKIALLLVFPSFLGVYFIYSNNQAKEAYAVDPITVSYDGHTTPDPIFEVANMLPGDESEKTFNVANNTDSPLTITLKGTKTFELLNFSEILEIIISENPGNDLYGGSTGFKLLKDFLSLPPLPLGSINANSNKSFRIKVLFPSTAGNNYQLAKVIFDLEFKTVAPPIELPPECAHLQGIIVKKITGTEGRDNIRATHIPELIEGLGGDDKLYGGAGDDCIVGGEGNDKIDGDQGNDVIIGGAGDDKLEGGSNNDIIWGGFGDDYIEGDSGNDTIYSDSGNDEVEGGSGHDTIYGFDGDDKLEGNSGNDTIYGEEGNDKLYGSTGVDFLNGGNGNDYLNGGTSTDTCTQGETLNSCEL